MRKKSKPAAKPAAQPQPDAPAPKPAPAVRAGSNYAPAGKVSR